MGQLMMFILLDVIALLSTKIQNPSSSSVLVIYLFVYYDFLIDICFYSIYLFIYLFMYLSIFIVYLHIYIHIYIYIHAVKLLLISELKNVLL